SGRHFKLVIFKHLNIFLGIGSSKVGEDSLSHHGDPSIGVYVIDRYTYYVLEFLEKYQPQSDGGKTTLGHFMEVCPKRLCISTVTVRLDLYPRDPYQVSLSDFFGNVATLHLIPGENNRTENNRAEIDPPAADQKPA